MISKPTEVFETVTPTAKVCRARKRQLFSLSKVVKFHLVQLQILDCPLEFTTLFIYLLSCLVENGG